jgi:rubrerythrin
MAKTLENLKEAFTGESKASTTYLAFARKAEQEGFPQVAKLFRAASFAETVHARNHLDVMEGIKSTQENLKSAISGENMEHVKMYPEFIEQANREQQPKAARTFDYARKVEIMHEELYKAALDAIKAGSKPKATEYYICQICGATIEDSAPDRCPVCGAPKVQFVKVD